MQDILQLGFKLICFLVDHYIQLSNIQYFRLIPTASDGSIVNKIDLNNIYN